MSELITLDLSCDVCGDWTDGCCCPRRDIPMALRKIRKEAHMRGWRTRRAGKLIDVCPECVARKEATDG